ncbi:MAG: tRNA 2-thiocytidine biosynthesis protein TtcA [Clostridia bacterium]|nr:tRNA 2-thiocytidine biosynthesis protein TtcA [Clostridia bacterium]
MENTKCKQIERSIIKRYRKELWSRFVQAVKEYQLIQEGDRIAVCISGGKDSFLMAKLLQEIQRHGKINFQLKFIVMDPGYRTENRQLILTNAELLEIPVELFESPIFEVVSVAGGSPCYLCARMRRGYLYEKAKALNCNKIALGHHFDDVIETTLLSMFYGAEIKTMLPKLKSTSHPGMELIRPLYKIHEDDVIRWANGNELTFLHCACRFTERVANKEEESKRKEMKALVKQLKATYDRIDDNIFRSMHNVNMNSILGYKKDGKAHSFLDGYDGE